MAATPLLGITFGRATGQPANMLPRHRHREANLAVVLSGGYLEAGDYGRRYVTAGDVLIHSAFEAHLNRFSSGRTEVLSFALPWSHRLPVRGRLRDPDAVVRIAEQDLAEAMATLMTDLQPSGGREEDWPDLLAARLGEEPDLRLEEWANEHGIVPSSVSRGFRLAYGTSPRRFRAEWRARHAWRSVMEDKRPLAQVAFEHGFSDQAHMNRSVVALTGYPPGSWRHAKSVQDGDFGTA